MCMSARINQLSVNSTLAADYSPLVPYIIAIAGEARFGVASRSNFIEEQRSSLNEFGRSPMLEAGYGAAQLFACGRCDTSTKLHSVDDRAVAGY